MPFTKSERTKEIAAILTADPTVTLQSIADRYQISRERVRQIIRANNLIVGPKQRRLATFRKPCPDCGKSILRRHLRCMDCLIISNTVHLICMICDKPYTRRKADVTATERRRGKINACSRSCWGKYAGSHYGFRVHPQTIQTKARQGLTKRPLSGKDGEKC